MWHSVVARAYACGISSAADLRGGVPPLTYVMCDLFASTSISPSKRTLGWTVAGKSGKPPPHCVAEEFRAGQQFDRVADRERFPRGRHLCRP